MNKMLENKGYVANVKVKIQRDAVCEKILLNKQPGRILKRRMTTTPTKSILRRSQYGQYNFDVGNENRDLNVGNTNQDLVAGIENANHDLDGGIADQEVPHSSSRPLPQLLLLNKVNNRPFNMAGRRRKSCDVYPTTSRFQG